uniref:Uncharacterized protein n=1 Tax=Chromera velia CCMP2878 TaxID=1169474 RepID=A0A0G4IFQ3_9ALVE|eukprot:Cvel_14042.t1-p1 / transcript=Cvel_14042.t1 / gene=Cvel_14042 / organism=Chromera_velia_CCMP2878 / gene_product=hypothetical protein / transcript_product=hypothetical protein / location=Cvel_scaffold984:23238-24664(+) / protein_length=317 / sequence_SO=supercontig / SO=protein_coding / is_pseudo=false
MCAVSSRLQTETSGPLCAVSPRLQTETSGPLCAVSAPLDPLDRLAELIASEIRGQLSLDEEITRKDADTLLPPSKAKPKKPSVSIESDRQLEPEGSLPPSPQSTGAGVFSSRAGRTAETASLLTAELTSTPLSSPPSARDASFNGGERGRKGKEGDRENVQDPSKAAVVKRKASLGALPIEEVCASTVFRCRREKILPVSFALLGPSDDVAVPCLAGEGDGHPRDSSITPTTMPMSQEPAEKVLRKQVPERKFEIPERSPRQGSRRWRRCPNPFLWLRTLSSTTEGGQPRCDCHKHYTPDLSLFTADSFLSPVFPFS